MKLRDLLNDNKKIKLNESWGNDESPQMTSEDKQAFMETVANFNSFGESIYREANFQEMVENINQMIEGAKQVALSEGDWFDGVTVQRHMKGLGESQKVFEKTCKEMSVLQQRLEACYEDIGGTLGKYFNINELTDEGNAFGAAVQKAKAEDEDEFTVDGEKYELEEMDKTIDESIDEAKMAVNPNIHKAQGIVAKLTHITEKEVHKALVDAYRALERAGQQYDKQQYAKHKKKNETTRPKQVYDPKDYDKKGNRIKKEYHGPRSTGYNPSVKDVDKKYAKVKDKKKK
jgi:hypothetical protein